MPADRLGRAALAGALLVALVGVCEMVAWSRQWTGVLRIRSEYSAIKFNTALALTVVGGAIALATLGRPPWARAGGLLVALVGLATLVEITLRVDLGFDELIVRDDLASPGRVPGRMTAVAAFCFLAIGIALLTWRTDLRRGWARASSAAAALVGIAGLAGICRYLANVPDGRGWRVLEPMAIPTSLSLCVLSASMLALVRRTAWPREGTPPAWVAAPAGVGAFVAVVLTWQLTVGTRQAGTVPAIVASRAVLVIAMLVGLLLGLAVAFGLRSNRRHQDAVALAAALSAEVALRTRVEAAARESERTVVQVLEALPVGVALFTPDGRLRFLNRAASRLNGREVDGTLTTEGLSAHLGVVVPETEPPCPLAGSTLRRALGGEASYADDGAIRHVDGTLVPVETWGAPVLGADGDVDLAVIVAADISERRASERAAVEQAALLDLARDAIFALDGERRVTYWSRGAEACYGYTREEALGRVGYELLRTEFPHRLQVEETLLREGHWDGELAKLTRSGERIIVAGRLTGGYEADGSTGRLLVIDTDITARKEAEAELARHAAAVTELNVALTRSNEELEQFAYIASHDLSEPLRAISGPVSLLARRYQGRLDADADEFIGYAVDGCERMQALINDLLEFSRVGGNGSALVPVDLEAVLEQVLAVLTPTVRERAALVSHDALPTITGDGPQMGQVFQNLIGNAVKFTPADRTPRIHVGHSADADVHRFTVTDNGIGVAERHRERVFGMFKRLHGHEEYPGTGIGLALCQKIVQRHGGAIGIDDGPVGCGSTFWFTLPVDRGERP